MKFCLVIAFAISLSACCQRSFSYPVIGDVTQIVVTASDGSVVGEVSDQGTVNDVIRFVDERRSHWCARSSSTPNGYIKFLGSDGGKGKIGLRESPTKPETL